MPLPRPTRLPEAAAALFMLLGLLACGDTRLQPSLAEVQLTPEQLDFGTVPQGVHAERALQVLNLSKRPLQLTLSAEVPFRVSSPSLELPVGQALTLTVYFQPREVGHVKGALHFSVEGKAQELVLEGEGIPQPLCTAASACQQSSFSTEEGRCVQQPLPDGTACTSTCLLAPQCEAGACRGEARVCDDGDACTDDACGEGVGCLHLPRSCDDGNPCTFEECRPSVGCASLPLPDGSACGDGRTCQRGQCTWRRLSEAERCARPTPCQPAGVWTGAGCQRPSAARLAPAWTYRVPKGSSMSGLIADEAGNLYLSELSLTDSVRQLVSVNRAGALRFRVPAGGPRASRMMVVGEELFSLEIHGGRDLLVVHDAKTGQERRRRELLAELGLESGFYYGLALSTEGAILVTASRNWNEEDIHLVWLSPSSLDILRKQVLPKRSSLLAVDEAGHLILDEDAGTRTVRTRQGDVLWQRRELGWRGDAFFGGIILQADGQLVRTVDATRVFDLHVQGGMVTSAPNPRFLLPDAAIILGDAWADETSFRAYARPPPLVAVQPLPQGLAWVAQPDDGEPFASLSDVLLTADGSLLYVRDDGAGGFRLRAVRLTGEVLYECPLPDVAPPFAGMDWYGDRQLTLTDQWLVFGRDEGAYLMSFAVPGATRPAHGWPFRDDGTLRAR